MNYIDTHAHMSDERYDNEIDSIIENAQQAGVRHILVPDVGIEGREELMALCDRFPSYLHPMVGVHPTTINDRNGDWRSEVDEVERLLATSHERYCAVGEIGLDHYWSCGFNREQRLAFEAQCELALQHNLPINIHTREAWGEMCEVLEQFRGRGLRGVMHAFCDTVDSFRRIDACGEFLFSIGGVVTFKRSQVAKVAADIPLEKLLLETDAPWLTPSPHRGERNEPAYLEHICAKIAEIKSVDPEVVAAVTTANAKHLFGV
ncbi:MAG: TatD family hydrolase [Rikenellaceae bacterium]